MAAPSLRRRNPHRRGRCRNGSIPELGFAVEIGEIDITECEMVNQFQGSAKVPPQFHARLRAGLSARPSARRCRWRWSTGRCGLARARRGIVAPAQDEEFVLSHCDNVQATGFRRASEAAALRRLPGRTRTGASHAPSGDFRRGRKAGEASTRQMTPVRRPRNDAKRFTATYNFAYLDEQTKRMIRRAILKAVAIPGYQVPFASREMPMPYGWGTGGVQVTAAVIGPDDVLKVIDQGADDTTNAVSIRKFFEKTAGVETTTRRAKRPMIQTRHRIPETPLTAARSWSIRCRSPSRCAFSSRARPKRARCMRSRTTASCM
jgi:hypothetical protein